MFFFSSYYSFLFLFLRKPKKRVLDLNRYRVFTKKDTQRKDTQRKDTQRKDTQRKDTQRKDTQRKDTQRKDTQRKDTQGNLIKGSSIPFKDGKVESPKN
jgi:hypothetical protein